MPCPRLAFKGLQAPVTRCLLPAPPGRLGRRVGRGGHKHGPPTASHLPFPFQGSAPILVAMVILLNIGVAILFINFFI